MANKLCESIKCQYYHGFCSKEGHCMYKKHVRQISSKELNYKVKRLLNDSVKEEQMKMF